MASSSSSPPVVIAAPAAHRLKIPLPSKFAGESGVAVDEFLSGMERQFRYYGAAQFSTEASCIEYAVMFFESKVATWYTATITEMRAQGNNVATWNEFSALLRKRYQPIEAAMVARQRLDSLRQDRRSVQVYTEYFYRQMNYIKDMSTTDQLHVYTRGLANGIKQEVQKTKPTTIQAAINAAILAESFFAHTGQRAASSQFYPSYSRATSSSTSAHPAHTSAPMDVNAIDRENDPESFHEPKFWPEPQDSASAPSSERESGLVARLEQMERRLNAVYGQQGRSSDRGPARSGPPSSAQHGRVSGVSAADVRQCREENLCIKCKKPGHYARDCRHTGPPVPLKQ
jgi:hypothetical protein